MATAVVARGTDGSAAGEDAGCKAESRGAVAAVSLCCSEHLAGCRAKRAERVSSALWLMWTEPSSHVSVHPCGAAVPNVGAVGGGDEVGTGDDTANCSRATVSLICDFGFERLCARASTRHAWLGCQRFEWFRRACSAIGHCSPLWCSPAEAQQARRPRYPAAAQASARRCGGAAAAASWPSQIGEIEAWVPCSRVSTRGFSLRSSAY